MKKKLMMFWSTPLNFILTYIWSAFLPLTPLPLPADFYTDVQRGTWGGVNQGSDRPDGGGHSVGTARRQVINDDHWSVWPHLGRGTLGR